MPPVQLETLIFGKKTNAVLLASWKGALVEVRQHDIISGENIVMIDKETLLKLAEMIKEEK